MSEKHPPHWKLPSGVTRGMWDYAHAEHIADDYDNYFAFNQMFTFDEQVIARHFITPGTVIDIGCGTGRALLPLVRRGFQGIAVDLSEEMVRVVREKSRHENLDVTCLQANAVDLDCVDEGAADYALCLFSTLGMIQGRKNRIKALGHMQRVLRPGGLLVLHVHNFWFNLYDPGGLWWVLKSVLKGGFRKDFEMGDKFFDYRGIPNMFLHVFRLRELRADFRRSGFRVREITFLNTARNRELRHPWLFGTLRANGWIIVCEKSE